MSSAAAVTTGASRQLVQKTLVQIYTAPKPHFVGDGFLVHGMFDYGPGAHKRSPFLLMDYGAERTFAANPPPARRRGVGLHPHRGFETVTIAYKGEVEHKDTHGGGGVIGPGDCQWMTAGSGLQHEEFHSKAYSQTGGPFEMMQLWINLPARLKMTPPKYHGISAKDVPSVPIADGKGVARLYAGSLDGHEGPHVPHTPLAVWDVRLEAGAVASLPQPEGWTAILTVQRGAVVVNGHAVQSAQAIHLSNEGSGIAIAAGPDGAQLLFLAGEPIDEPVVGHGPFVMNTRAEIEQAFADLNAGKI